MANEILRPEGYGPGFTDNFASNEAIAAGFSATDICPFLSPAPLWPSYYANIPLHSGKGPALEKCALLLRNFRLPGGGRSGGV